uniref:Uncharacterized protein n=1 Tax=Cacopsylla melanoneura TaxID=428564 RepID=A0A8D8TEE4_9HEMI
MLYPAIHLLHNLHPHSSLHPPRLISHHLHPHSSLHPPCPTSHHMHPHSSLHPHRFVFRHSHPHSFPKHLVCYLINMDLVSQFCHRCLHSYLIIVLTPLL